MSCGPLLACVVRGGAELLYLKQTKTKYASRPFRKRLQPVKTKKQKEKQDAKFKYILMGLTVNQLRLFQGQ